MQEKINEEFCVKQEIQETNWPKKFHSGLVLFCETVQSYPSQVGCWSNEVRTHTKSLQYKKIPHLDRGHFIKLFCKSRITSRRQGISHGFSLLCISQGPGGQNSLTKDQLANRSGEASRKQTLRDKCPLQFPQQMNQVTEGDSQGKV